MVNQTVFNDFVDVCTMMVLFTVFGIQIDIVSHKTIRYKIKLIPFKHLHLNAVVNVCVSFSCTSNPHVMP